MLSRLGVSDVNALVRLYPRVYEDWSRIKSINEAQIGEICCIKGIVGSPVRKNLIRKGLTLYKTEITDGSGIMGITISTAALRQKSSPRATSFCSSVESAVIFTARR